MDFEKEFETPAGNKVEDPEGSKVENPEGAKIKTPDELEEKFEFPEEAPDISPEVKLKETELKKYGMYEKLKNFKAGDTIIFELADGRRQTYESLDEAIKFFVNEGPDTEKGDSEIKDFYLDSGEKG